MSQWIAKLTWSQIEGELILTQDLHWTPKGTDPVLALYAGIANLMSSPPSYEYRVADGYPGYRLAQRIKQRLKADKIELAPLPPMQKDAVY